MYLRETASCNSEILMNNDVTETQYTPQSIESWISILLLQGSDLKPK